MRVAAAVSPLSRSVRDYRAPAQAGAVTGGAAASQRSGLCRTTVDAEDVGFTTNSTITADSW
jgi:hypothetical protein